MLQSRDVEIGGRRFLVTQLPAMRGVKLLTRLGKVLGPALAAVAGAAGKGGLLDVDVAKLGDVASLLFEALSPEETESILRELFASTEVFNDDGTRKQAIAGAFDAAFSDVGQVFALAKVALEVNFSGFLGGLLAQAKGLGRASPSAGSSTSSGLAGV